jgi:hypothetical protein
MEDDERSGHPRPQRSDENFKKYRIWCIQIDVYVQWPLEKFVDWRQCAAVMQREAVTVMPSCSGGGYAVVV